MFYIRKNKEKQNTFNRYSLLNQNLPLNQKSKWLQNRKPKAKKARRKLGTKPSEQPATSTNTRCPSDLPRIQTKYDNTTTNGEKFETSQRVREVEAMSPK